MSEAHEVIDSLKGALEVATAHRKAVSGIDAVKEADENIRNIVDTINMVARAACLPVCVASQGKP